MLIPSIDLMDGKAVQLRQGREKVLEREDAMGLAKEFSRYGEVALIDLDAALGKGDNLPLMKEICKIAECRVGGGIRTIERANELLDAGAKKIIIGTRATKDFLSQLPKERIIIAIDTKEGFVVDNGWTNMTSKRPEELIDELSQYCSEFLFTDVDIEGTMKGIDADKIMKLKKLQKLAESVGNRITIAGGIKSIEEIKIIEDLGCNSQLGLALYTGRVRLDEAFAAMLRFDANGLIPTIVQDNQKNVLMLAYSSRESLIEGFRSGNATYFSRSRNRLWTKGESSGNMQRLLRARYDCDMDSLLFTVNQKDFACHQGSYSCFGTKGFCFESLYAKIKDRGENPRLGSYTSTIFQDEKMIMEKISEESDEVVNYTDRSNLVWEIADLTYFLLVLMAKKGIRIEEVKNKLWGRDR